MAFDESEAYFQSDEYDWYDQSYTKDEIEDYVYDIEHDFKEYEKNSYVIVRNPRYKKRIVSRLYLVNRAFTKRFWWSPDANYALKLQSKEAALKIASKYKYGKVRVVKISDLCI